MKKYITICLLFLGGLSFAQQEQKSKSDNPNPAETSKSLTPMPVVGSDKDTNTELALTPEQQGFTKFVENGKTIYRKENNGVIVEYIPEQ